MGLMLAHAVQIETRVDQLRIARYTPAVFVFEIRERESLGRGRGWNGRSPGGWAWRNFPWLIGRRRPQRDLAAFRLSDGRVFPRPPAPCQGPGIAHCESP